uniref:G-protein coupled receptors family 1 profile domain-containing protein n=1 Tax=Parascaris univalens TaxID=6257 RepID=A0A915A7G5_PARUN
MSDEEEAFQRSDDGDLKAPTLIATDYLEIAVLAVVLCIGVPLNAVVLRKLLRLYSTGVTLSRAKQDETRIGFLMLQIHLTIVDLIFIILYCPSKLIWLICYVWPFGAFLCKAVQYSWLVRNLLSVAFLNFYRPHFLFDFSLTLSRSSLDECLVGRIAKSSLRKKRHSINLTNGNKCSKGDGFFDRI